MKQQRPGGHRNPEQTVTGTDLPQEIPPAAPVIPDPVFPVNNQTEGQLHQGYDSRPAENPYRQGQSGSDLTQPPHQQQAEPSRRKHADMTPTPPEQFQPNISPSADAELSQTGCQTHNHHLPGIMPNIF